MPLLLPTALPALPAALISEGILVTPSMMAHHRLFMLSEAFEVHGGPVMAVAVLCAGRV